MLKNVNSAFEKFMKDSVNLDPDVVVQARNSMQNLLKNISEFNNNDFFHFKYVVDKIKTKIKDFQVVKNIIMTFIPITILTVIYPLHFMPIAEGKIPEISFSILNFFYLWLSLKGLLLTLLFISTIGSMFYFIALCKKHIRNYQKIKKMISEDCIDIKKYCELFPRVDNPQ